VSKGYWIAALVGFAMWLALIAYFVTRVEQVP
jgi:hypothetical protein